jgi:hypothetical protein
MPNGSEKRQGKTPRKRARPVTSCIFIVPQPNSRDARTTFGKGARDVPDRSGLPDTDAWNDFWPTISTICEELTGKNNVGEVY